MGELFNPYAFALGMVALLNPCGFALLPAYLGFFLGLEDQQTSRIGAMNRAQLVGLALSAGFLAVFGAIGLVLAGFYSSIQPVLPWLTMVMGVGLVILGIAMLRGFDLTVALPKFSGGTGNRSLPSMFIFGVSYALASLSCTIGLFLSVVGTSSSSRSFIERLGGFVSYGLGMGLLATALTLGVAFGKRELVGQFRQLMPKINLISAVVLVIVGAYVVIYGWWSVQVLVFHDPPTNWVNSIVREVESWQANLTAMINSRSRVLGWMFLILNAGLMAAGLASRRGASRRPQRTPQTSRS